MKQILITGVNSYIGNAIEQYLMEYNSLQGREIYRVDKISLREESWRTLDFSGYDAILHVAGIAHADIGRVSEETKALYYQVNCDLTLEVAKKAKNEGVRQFVYFSSVIVYGDSARVGEQKLITAATRPEPANFYGDSKLQAEIGLEQLKADEFLVAVLRPPMIYGKNSKGNFPLLVKLADKLPVFPAIDNQRSMLYVENLAEFVRLVIEQQRGGILFPQNEEYVTTAKMVQSIGEVRGKRILLWKVLKPLVYLAAKMPGKIGGLVNKAFGSLTIDKALSVQDIQGYQIYALKESIQKSVRNYEG
ncbi:MAG: NAD-dependent epimerase/dehydratase family protein [Lachnospiraceae bacterium]|nr:NAD-dependent epimerase/dehydratase family protein [Lachnospiraceae bacterium]